MEMGLRVSKGLSSVVWTTARLQFANSFRSSDFTVAGSAYHLEIRHGRFIGGTNYRLLLFVKDIPAATFYVTGYLSEGSDLLFPFTRQIKEKGEHCIWENKTSAVSQVAPDFDYQSRWRFYVVFHFVLSDHSHSEDKSLQTPTFFDAHIGTQSLSEDLSKLLDGDPRADVELKCGDVTFKAHRSLLSVRSEVFRAMLDSDMAERKTGQVQIVDAEADLFQHFLRYLYSGKLEELTVDAAKRLYELGDKYSVEALKRQCANFLAENLSPDNVIGILSMADRHTDGDLEEIATAYIVEQKIPHRDDVWSDFCSSHPVMAMKILNRSYKLFVPGT